MILQVGVKVLLQNTEGQVLVLRRSAKYETAEGSWDIPGGRIDADATLTDNLAREVKEETKLELTSDPMLMAAQDIFFQNNAGEDKHIVRLTYVATAEGEPVLDGVEHTEYQWIDFAELATLPNLDAYLAKLVSEGVITADSWN